MLSKFSSINGVSGSFVGLRAMCDTENLSLFVFRGTGAVTSCVGVIGDFQYTTMSCIRFIILSVVVILESSHVHVV